ncbi:MAG TPA: hypothetical protein VEU51_07625 [Candidatus Acidoferrales bacterium]|nr:hypothetical protein [Candidatus Acidoferrales bacterium]
MPLVTGETVKQVLHDLYGYEVSAEDAQAIAHGAGAMLTLAGNLASLDLTGIEPPQGYAVMIAEATRLAKIKS